MLKMVFCDIDGCMGEFIKQEYPLKQDLCKNRECLEKIKSKVNNFFIKDVVFGVCTGRSFYQADSIMHLAGYKGPSIFEMGNVIFEPEEGVYHLFERHEKFRSSLSVIKEFTEWKDEIAWEEEKIRKKFPNSKLRQIKDRTCMLTYEFEKNIAEELYSYLLIAMPKKFKEAIDKNILKVLKSKNALDIFPNLSKGEAVSYLLKKYNVQKNEVLAIGDSSHSDLDFLKSAGFIACPDNADETLKNFVLENNGFVVPNKFAGGVLNIFDLVENYVKYAELRA